MKVLITCDRYPRSLADGLVLRIYHYVRHLNSRHTFDLVCYGSASERQPEIDALFGSVRIFEQPGRPRAKGMARWLGALDSDSLFTSSPDVVRHLEQAAPAGAYDLVWDAGCNMLRNLRALRRRLPLLADQVDDTSIWLRRILDLQTGLYPRMRTLQQIWLRRRFERRHIAGADAVLFVSDLDALAFRATHPHARVAVISNGVDTEFFAPAASPVDPYNLVFEGSMAFAPNADGAIWFAREIFPLVRARVPGATFTVVGRDPLPEVEALRSPSIEVTGSVADVRPYLARAALFVCPLRSGAGIKNKILQAWAMGKAAVATPESIGGLEIDEGANILVRDGPEAFADAVCDLLEDPARAAPIGQSARALAVTKYNWEAKARELEALMLRIASGHR